LTDAQWALTRRAMELYRRVAPIIRDGVSRRTGSIGESWRHPTGYQAVTYTSHDGRSALVVVHAFGEAPPIVRIPLDGAGDWRLVERFGSATAEASIVASELSCTLSGDFVGSVFLLEQ
jgi:alpha-galactosidase